MAMAVSFDGSVALSVSADHLVGKYDLNVCDSRNQPDALTYLLKPTCSQIRSIPQGRYIERSTPVTVR
jgi:hypothetical protein